MSAGRVLVVGGTSMDLVLPASDFPQRGGFSIAEKFVERQGGSAANVAMGVASASVETFFANFIIYSVHSGI